jgi:peptidylprolyl isomerase
MRRATRLTVLIAATAVALTACSGSSGGSSSSSSASSGAAQATKVGVKLAGAKVAKPTLTIPATAAPAATSAEVLSAGDGEAVVKGDVLVVNYLGQTWAPKDGKPNVFDNSYDKGQPTGFAIGVGAVVKGWDATLVGQKLGSRVLLAITPADGYGATATAQNALGGQTLVFVVDLLKSIKGDTIATGAAAAKVPAGFPAVTSTSGKRPEITSVKGVKASAKPASALLLKGTGEKIDVAKQLVLQYLQTDAATGKQTQRTWDAQQPQVVPAQGVVGLVEALKDQPVGSRAVVVTAKQGTSPAQILVIDVIGQF